MIFDPTLYGPPTIFQSVREQMHAVAHLVQRDYQKAAEPILALLERYPDDRRLKGQLAELETAHMLARHRATAPLLKILMMELCPSLCRLDPDGKLTPIEERVPMMGEFQW